MLKLSHLTSTKKFLSVIDNCDGDVCLHLRDGRICSLKNDPALRSFLTMVDSADGDYGLDVSESEDMRKILQFIYEERLA